MCHPVLVRLSNLIVSRGLLVKMRSAVHTNKSARPYVGQSRLKTWIIQIPSSLNVNRELLVTRPLVLVSIDFLKNQCSPVRFLSDLARWNASVHIYVLGVVTFLFSLASTYVVCFLEFKESKFTPLRECNLTVLSAVSMKQCSIAVFKLYPLGFTTNLFCLGSL